MQIPDYKIKKKGVYSPIYFNINSYINYKEKELHDKSCGSFTYMKQLELNCNYILS